MSSLKLVLAIVVLMQVLYQPSSAEHFPLTHPRVVELSAIKHLTKNLPIEIKCAALKDKLREVAPLDDGSLLTLTIEALETKRVPFRNNHYLVNDLKECKRRMGPTDGLTGEAALYAKIRALNSELEQLKELLRLKQQSKEERDRLIDSVSEQVRLAYKLMGSENESASFLDRCYVYFILFGKQRPLSLNSIESVVNMRPGLQVFKGEAQMDSETKRSLAKLAKTLESYKDMEYSRPSLELNVCLEYVKIVA